MSAAKNEPQQQTEQQPSAQQPPAGEPSGMAQLENKIEEVVVNVLDKLGVGKGKGKGETEQAAPDIASQVRKAVADAKSEEQRTAAEQARDARIKKLEEAAASKEQPPSQFRKIEAFFGWRGKDGDDK